MKILRRIGRYILFLILGLVALSLLLIAALQVPSVQTWAAGKAAVWLSESLSTEVRVGGVDIDFFKTVVLEDIYVADQHGDTLLSARRLSADIGIFDLFGSEIYLNEAKLEGAAVNLRRTGQDSVFNYQFIIDAFDSGTPADTTAAPWTFGIGQLDLENVRFDMLDEGSGRFDLRTAIHRLTVTAKELDLTQQNIALGRFELLNSSVGFRTLLADSTLATNAVADTSRLEFPGIGWTITADEIRFANNYLELLDDNAPLLENALDYSHLRLNDLDLSIDDLHYADDGILGKIIAGSTRDSGGFQLDELSADVQVLPNGILVDGLVLRTPFSHVENDTKLIFSEFNDLTDFFNRVKVVSAFGESHLAVNDLLMLAPALRDIENLAFPEGGTLEMLGQAALENERLTLAALTFAAGKNIKLKASGSIERLTTDPHFDLRVEQLVASYSALRPWLRGVELPPGLQSFGETSLSGHIEGSLDDLSAKGLVLATQSATRFEGDFKVRDLPDMDKAYFSVKIKDLATRSADLQGFATSPLPPQLDSLGLVQFSGNFNGFIRDFAVDGSFQTSAGAAKTDLSLRFNKDYSFATYKGRLAMEGFDLGRVLGDTLVGKLWLDAELNGEGLTQADLNTTMTGVVEKAEFRGYMYQNLQVDGRFVQQQFDGKMSMQDPSLSFDLSGRVNLNDSLPDVDATVQIDTINFKNLNLSPQDLGLSGRMEARLVGNTLDNLRGKATLTDFALQSDEQKYFDQKIVLEAQQLGADQRALLFDADFLKARVVGRYKFNDLPDLVIGYINDFFPVEELTLPPDSLLSPHPEVADQQFEFEFRFTNLTSLTSIFLPGLTAVDTSAYLRGKFDSAEKQLEMTGVFPNLKYENNTLDSLLLGVNGNRRRLRSSLAVRNLDAGGTFFAPYLDLSTRMGADTLRFDLSMRDDTLGTDFKWGGRSTETVQDYRLVFDKEMVLDGDTWQVAPENELRFSRNALNVSNLVFQKNVQTIAVNSGAIAPPDDLAPLEVRFENFRLREISALLNNPDLRLTGGLNGEFIVKEPRQNLHFNADVLVDSLMLNEQLLGNLTVEAAQPAGQRNIEVRTELTGENQAEVTGNYAIESSEFDLRAELGKLSMVVLDPFLKAFIRESEGHLSGSFTVNGTPDQPKVNGSVTTHDLSTEVVLSGTRYRTGENVVRLSEKEIDLGEFVLFDTKNQRATLSGSILHSYFNDIRLDLRAQTAGLQILNTTREDNPLYYGRLFASADVTITGTAELPRLDVEATTLDSSLLHVEPLTSVLAVIQEDYVIFANPNSYQPDSLTLLEKKVGRGDGGFELNLVLTVTPAAVLNVIIDPLTGDELFCSGRGNFIIKMNPAGDLSITGAYFIEEGKYTFNYEGLVKREFEIRKGSSLSFAGDPFDARFDIQAVYNTRATTYELLANEANLDETTLSSSKRRTSVEVELNIDGSLLEPEITFDIKLPNTEGGVLDNLVLRKLSDLRDDPNELNKQVFGLLFFNSFIQSEGGAGFANVGENAALKSVSGLITTQLNRFADRLIPWVNLELGFESYRAAGQDAGTVTELQVGLSQQLFSDRLTIRLGGNFNLDNTQESAVQPGGYSAIAGDFVLEYKLNEAGTYLLKVFTKSDYNSILQDAGYKTGIGVMYRMSY